MDPRFAKLFPYLYGQKNQQGINRGIELVDENLQVIERDDIESIRGNLGHRKYNIGMRKIDCSSRVQSIDVWSNQNFGFGVCQAHFVLNVVGTHCPEGRLKCLDVQDKRISVLHY